MLQVKTFSRPFVLLPFLRPPDGGLRLLVVDIGFEGSVGEVWRMALKYGLPLAVLALGK